MGFAIADALMGDQPDYANQAKKQEQARQAAITSGTQNINQAFAGFNPAFYQKRQQAYLDYALPQFNDQYNQTRKQVGFGIANKGLRKSGAAQQDWSDLFRQASTSKQAIADTARGQANDLQMQVANQKNNLLNMLYQSADPAAAASSATTTATSLQQPSTFAPLANMFSGLVNQYYLGQVLNQRPVASNPGTSYGSAFAPLPPTTSSGS